MSPSQLSIYEMNKNNKIMLKEKGRKGRQKGGREKVRKNPKVHFYSFFLFQ